MKRFIPHLVWLTGLLLLLIAAAKSSGAALPYQDPTAELLTIQRGQLQSAKAIAASGGILVFIGVGWSIGRRFRRPQSAP
jgi:hypothetical protein